jgi:hypothetical protein
MAAKDAEIAAKDVIINEKTIGRYGCHASR